MAKIDQLRQNYLTASSAYKQALSSEPAKKISGDALTKARDDFLSEFQMLDKIRTSKATADSAVANRFQKILNEHHHKLIHLSQLEQSDRHYLTTLETAIDEAVTQLKTTVQPDFSTRVKNFFATKSQKKQAAQAQSVRNDELDAFLDHPREAPIGIRPGSLLAQLMTAGFGGKSPINRSVGLEFSADAVYSALNTKLVNYPGYPYEAYSINAMLISDLLTSVNRAIAANPGANQHLITVKNITLYKQLELKIRNELNAKDGAWPKSLTEAAHLYYHAVVNGNAYAIQAARQAVDVQIASANGGFVAAVKDTFSGKKQRIADEQAQIKEIDNFVKYGAKAPIGLGQASAYLLKQGFNGAAPDQRASLAFNTDVVKVVIANIPDEALQKALRDLDQGIAKNGLENSLFLSQTKFAINSVIEQRKNSIPADLKPLVEVSKKYGFMGKKFKEAFSRILQGSDATSSAQVEKLTSIRKLITIELSKARIKNSPSNTRILKQIDGLLTAQILLRQKAQEYCQGVMQALVQKSTDVVSDSADKYQTLAQMPKEQLNALQQKAEQGLTMALGKAERDELTALIGKIKETRQANIKSLPEELKGLGRARGVDFNLRGTLEKRTGEALVKTLTAANQQLDQPRIKTSPSSKAFFEEIKSTIADIQKVAEKRYDAVMEQTENLGSLSDEKLVKLQQDLSKLNEAAKNPGSGVYGLSEGQKKNLATQIYEIKALIERHSQQIPKKLKQILEAKNDKGLMDVLFKQSHADLTEVRAALVTENGKDHIKGSLSAKKYLTAIRMIDEIIMKADTRYQEIAKVKEIIVIKSIPELRKLKEKAEQLGQTKHLDDTKQGSLNNIIHEISGILIDRQKTPTTPIVPQSQLSPTFALGYAKKEDSVGHDRVIDESQNSGGFVPFSSSPYNPGS